MKMMIGFLLLALTLASSLAQMMGTGSTGMENLLPFMVLQGSDNLFPMMFMLNHQNPSASPMSPMSSMSSMWPLLMSGSDSARNAMLMSHFMQGMGGPAPVV